VLTFPATQAIFRSFSLPWFWIRLWVPVAIIPFIQLFQGGMTIGRSRHCGQRGRRFTKGANGPTRSASQTFLATARARRDVANAIWAQCLLMVRPPTASSHRTRRIGKKAVQGGNNLSTLPNRPADALD
jgi:hypothetical protein